MMDSIDFQLRANLIWDAFVVIKCFVIDSSEPTRNQGLNRYTCATTNAWRAENDPKQRAQSFFPHQSTINNQRSTINVTPCNYTLVFTLWLSKRNLPSTDTYISCHHGYPKAAEKDTEAAHEWAGQFPLCGLFGQTANVGIHIGPSTGSALYRIHWLFRVLPL